MNGHDDGIDRDALRAASTLLLISRALDHEVRQSTPDAPMSVADLSVMRQIERGVDLPSLIARALRLDPGRVTRITDTLVNSGYVARHEDAEDRRRCRLELTPEGTKRLDVGRLELSGVMHRLLEGISEEERAGLEHGLEAIRRGIEAEVPPRGA